MGIFVFLFRNPDRAEAPDRPIGLPPRPQPVADWEVRLDRYARKVSGILRSESVPTYTQRPVWDAVFPFWVISVGITEGYRTWPTVNNDRDRPFYYRGEGLLLTIEGQLVRTASDAVAVTRRENPMEFSDLDNWSSEWSYVSQWGWARDNAGYWRRVGTRGSVIAEEWQSRYDARWQQRPPDGRATSAALTRFLRTRRTMWPERAGL